MSEKFVQKQTNDSWYKIKDSNIKRLSSSVRIRCKYAKSLNSKITITIDGNQLQNKRSIKKKVPEKTPQEIAIDFENIFIQDSGMYKLIVRFNC